MTTAFNRESALDNLHTKILDVLDRRTREKLFDSMSNGSWVYGAGGCGRKLARLMREQGLPCLGFIDRNAASITEIEGLPVYTPSAFKPEMAKDRCFVSGVFNPAVDPADVLVFAKDKPFTDRLWNADLSDAFGSAADIMWMRERSFLLESFDSIRKVAMALSDPLSVQNFLSLVLFRLTGSSEDYPAHDLYSQYLPPDLPKFDRPIAFLDGGAYNGDSGAMLLKEGVALREWYAFEPDEKNFADLSRIVHDSGVKGFLFPCGLSNAIHQAQFMSDLGASSRMGFGEGNTITVQCVAIDQALPGAEIDFVKLDIEGAELAAMEGMATTVEANRPRMAISVYHKPEDLWAIPLKLMEMLPEAKLHIRQHGVNGFDTVAYAIPDGH